MYIFGIFALSPKCKALSIHFFNHIPSTHIILDYGDNYISRWSLKFYMVLYFMYYLIIYIILEMYTGRVLT